MENIYEIVRRNKNEAINILLLIEGNELTFEETEETDIPYILISLRDGELLELPVSKVKLNDKKDDILLYIDEFKEWINTFKPISFSVNYVYESIYDMYKHADCDLEYKRYIESVEGIILIKEIEDFSTKDKSLDIYLKPNDSNDIIYINNISIEASDNEIEDLVENYRN